MTGFLQRLAERAMGVSRPARAASAAPFVPMAEAVGGEMAAEIRPGSESAFVAAPSPDVRASAPAMMMSIEPLASAAQTRPDAPDTPAPRMPLVAELTTLKQKSAASPMAPASTPKSVLPTAGAHAASAQKAAPETRTTTPDIAPSLVAEDRLPHLPDSPARHPIQPAPPPLLAPTPEASTAFRAGEHRAGATADRRTQAVEETTEVHVHIGRIEVTAVHEPAPAKPAAARRPAPMSLDEYLAKRHGRPA